jgi:DNA-binding transcriptional ArsR family regulator
MSNNNSNWANWDVRSFQLVTGDVKRPQPVPRRGRRISPVKGKFIAGPIDVVWLSQARKLGVTALWVGLSLWYLRKLRGSDSIIVSNLAMQDWGVQPDAKRRALRNLKNAGLITIEPRGKRSPLVTLVVQDSDGSGVGKQAGREGLGLRIPR